MTEKKIVLSIDLMGADKDPRILLCGVRNFAKRCPEVRFLLHGDVSYFKKEVTECQVLGSRSELIHSDMFVTNDVKPSVAMRDRSKYSMTKAVASVKEGKADAVISCGNTGALMAISMLKLRLLPGIKRPALVSILPNEGGAFVLLDCGANVDVDADNLLQFAFIGTAFYKIMFDEQIPSVSILNIGTEKNKGKKYLHDAFQLLEASELNFTGFIEPNNIFESGVDVVVTDGFSGNVLIKGLEGVSKFIKNTTTIYLKSNLLFKWVGVLLLLLGLRKLWSKFNGRKYNGGVFGGINGLVVKSHGSADEFAFECSLDLAYKSAIKGLNSKILEQVKVDDIQIRESI